jgi:hypothetical protein
MRPHPDDLHYPFFLENLVNETVLDVDSPRVGPFEVTHQFLVWRRIPERVLAEDRQERLGLFAQARRRDLSGIFPRLFGEKNLPGHDVDLDPKETGSIYSKARKTLPAGFP